MGASFTGALCLLLCLLSFAALRLAQIAAVGMILCGVLRRAFRLVEGCSVPFSVPSASLFLALENIDIVDTPQSSMSSLMSLQLLGVTLLLLRNVLQFLKNVTRSLRTKSRVATSRRAIRSEAISRVRYRVSSRFAGRAYGPRCHHRSRSS